MDTFISRIISFFLFLVTISIPAAAHEESLENFLACLAEKSTKESAPPAPKPEDSCQLAIELLDSSTGQSIPGLIRITRKNGDALLLPGVLERGLGFGPELRGLRWHVILGRTSFLVPREVLKIEAFHDITTEITTHEQVDFTERKSAQIQMKLKRFHNPRARNWRNGNTHLHMHRITRAEADRYLREVPRGDGLELVFVSYVTKADDDHHYISNEYTSGDLASFSKDGVHLEHGEEHRHNFENQSQGYGHVMLLNIKKLILPVSIGPGIMLSGHDGIPIQRGIKTARQDGATSIWCHNTIGFEDIPNWISGMLEAQNIYDGSPLGSYEDSFYRYLNIGLFTPFSTGTDWFIYDFNRVYVELEGELTAEKWLEALSSGRSFITNGSILEFEVHGKRSGDTISIDKPSTLKITGRGIGRNDFGKLQLVHNGKVVHSTRSTDRGGHFEAIMSHSIEMISPGWLALRIPGTGQNEFNRPLFAHTSPVYVKFKGNSIFVPEVARGLIREMEMSLQTIGEKGTFLKAADREEVFSVYRQGIRELSERLDGVGAKSVKTSE